MLKRLFDIICSGFGLLLLSPFLLVIVLLIKASSKGPIFFRQIRVGQSGKLFRIHKFRTMVVDAEAKGLKITVGRDTRITSIGHILRKTKLDELPQLFDVFIGDMSLVGPRPEVPEYVAYYPQSVKDVVLSVKPGITDEASIVMIDENDILAGAMNPEETYIKQILPLKLDFAVNYVNNRGILVDIKIIFRTIAKIFMR